jgi:diguanylate cyclase (GGDEF)-like protein
MAVLSGKQPHFQEEFRYRNAGGGWTWIRCTGKVVARNPQGMALRAIGTNQDITARKNSEALIVNAAHHDWLTGLPNRFSLTSHLAEALHRAQRQERLVAVCMIDLDDFKPVNDTWGHEAGDQLLKELAQRLQRLLRKTDFVARLGGDEFVVVMEDLPPEDALPQLETALQRLHQAVESPFRLGGEMEAEVGMTVGLSLFPHDGVEPDALMRQADAAMYQAKQHKSGRRRWWRMVSEEAGYPQEENSHFEIYGAEAARLLRVEPSGVIDALERLIDRQRQADKELERLSRARLEDSAARLADAAVDGVVIDRLDGLGPDQLRQVRAGDLTGSHLRDAAAPPRPWWDRRMRYWRLVYLMSD